MPTRNGAGVRAASSANANALLSTNGLTAFNATGGAFAIAGWVRASNNMDLFYHGESASSLNSYNLRFAVGNAGIQLRIGNASAVTTTTFTLRTSFKYNQPFHLLVVCRSTGQVEWHINGELVHVQTGVSVPTTPSSPMTRVGAGQSSGVCLGDLYDVRVWAGTHVNIITAGAAKAIMHGQPFGETGRYLVGGFTPLDYSGRGNNLTMNSTSLNGPVANFPNITPDRRHRRRRISYLSPGTLFTQTLSGGITPSGTVTKQTSRTVSGGATPAGTVTKQTAHALAGGSTPAGTVTKQTSRTLSGGATPTGTVAKQTLRSLAGGITPAGALSALKLLARSLAGGITPAGTVTKSLSRSLAGGITPSGALVRRVSKILGGIVASSGAVARTIRRTLAGLLAPIGDLITFIGNLATGGEPPLIGTLTDTVALATMADAQTTATMADAQATATLGDAQSLATLDD